MFSHYYYLYCHSCSGPCCFDCISFILMSIYLPHQLKRTLLSPKSVSEIRPYFGVWWFACQNWTSLTTQRLQPLGKPPMNMKCCSSPMSIIKEDDGYGFGQNGNADVYVHIHTYTNTSFPPSGVFYVCVHIGVSSGPNRKGKNLICLFWSDKYCLEGRPHHLELYSMTMSSHILSQRISLLPDPYFCVAMRVY